MSEQIIFKSAWLPLRKKSVAFARSKGQELFFNLGGKWKDGETPEEALVREAREEACVELNRKTIQLFRVYEGPAHGLPGVLLRMSCFFANWEGVIRPGNEIAEIAWFTSKDMQRTTEMGKKLLISLYDGRYIS